MDKDTAMLFGGPLDQKVIDLGGDSGWRLVFPRYRDDGMQVNDVYDHASTRLHGERMPYRYAGEEIPPIPDPARLALTWRERFRDWLDEGRDWLSAFPRHR